ncbi:hypothetical protein SAMN04487887_11815 [Enterococcus casseliflavus]|uniref:hypothetical protein n=1 Tax=Enterococcus casseliflavus TaxID=37734 RepID=UPI0008E17292|nr:hypothetical protein [Enterococcus casseliflavus]SFE58498.1 hypothetical protein SAMN04487887_11815 [Enterococcus casseliflavus]
MKYSQMDHKRMWVEKLERDLSQLESLGYSIDSEVYKSAVKRTDKARKELKNLVADRQR